MKNNPDDIARVKAKKITDWYRKVYNKNNNKHIFPDEITFTHAARNKFPKLLDEVPYMMAWTDIKFGDF